MSEHSGHFQWDGQVVYSLPQTTCPCCHGSLDVVHTGAVCGITVISASFWMVVHTRVIFVWYIVTVVPCCIQSTCLLDQCVYLWYMYQLEFDICDIIKECVWFAFVCFVLQIPSQVNVIFTYSSRLPSWHKENHLIVPLLMKLPWRMWVKSKQEKKCQ